MIYRQTGPKNVQLWSPKLIRVQSNKIHPIPSLFYKKKLYTLKYFRKKTFPFLLCTTKCQVKNKFGIN